MDDKTKEALKNSIKHWEENAAAECPSEAFSGADYCDLCDLFNTEENMGCKGCPVSAKTGGMYCDKTPYMDAHNSLIDWRVTSHEGSSLWDERKRSFQRAAQKEVDFLKSLLPQEKK